MPEIRTQYYFLSSLRQGMAVNINASGNDVEARETFAVELNIRANDDVELGPIQKDIQLYGPGDILGFSPSIVTRTEPLENISNFEPNYFPFIEFADADFLWRFTPKIARADGSLLPWLTLIVLKAEGADVEFCEGSQCVGADSVDNDNRPWIQVFDQSCLPDLCEAWRWAHVQVTAEAGLIDESALDGDSSGFREKLKDIIRTEPERAVSRLLCARRLAPGTLYSAFVVPTFELGRRAGLDEPPGTEPDYGDTKAWVVPEPASPEIIQLPYYYKWQFRTGHRGDFEYLVRLLCPRKLSGLGIREMDCSEPGFGMPGIETTDHALELEGALMSLDTEYTEWGKDPIPDLDAGDSLLPSTPFQVSLAWDLLNKTSIGLIPSTALVDPVVVPPIYGRWHAGKVQVGTNDADDRWLDVLNLDPRHRTAAGFGTQVVQQDQEALMASAWDQLGNVDEANEILRRGQLGVEASSLVYQRLQSLPLEDFLWLSNPLHSRVLMENSEAGELKTVSYNFMKTRIPSAALDPAFRRIKRKRGAQRKRQTSDTAISGGMLQRFALGDLQAAGPKPKPDGMISLCDVSQAMQVEINRSLGSSSGPIDSTSVPDSVGAGPVIIELIGAPLSVPPEALFCGKNIDCDLITRESQATAGPSTTFTTPAVIVGTSSVTGSLQNIDRVAGGFLKRQILSSELSGPGTNIRGKISMSADGAPLSNANISVPGTNLRTFTNSRGEYVLPLPAGTHGVVVQAAGQPPVSSTVSVAENDTAVLDFIFGEGATIQGAVTDSTTGEPIVGAEVSLQGTTLNTVTDSNGRYTMETSPGNYTVLIRATGYPDRSTSIVAATSDGLIVDFVLLDTEIDDEDIRDAVCETVDSWLNSEYEDQEFEEISLEDTWTTILNSIDPRITIPQRIWKRLKFLDIPRFGGLPAKIMFAPEFPQPMYEPLRDISQDLLVPGIETVPDNTLGLLKTNGRFVESYMVGCNHEFAAELLWREYPTDQRGSYFRQFWDVSGYLPTEDEMNSSLDDWIAAWIIAYNAVHTPETTITDVGSLSVEEKRNIITEQFDRVIEMSIKVGLNLPTFTEPSDDAKQLIVDFHASGQRGIEEIVDNSTPTILTELSEILIMEEALEEKLKDIKKLTEWGDSFLGENDNKSAPPGSEAEENIVLIVRGELLKKYPNTVIYAVKAQEIVVSGSGVTKVIPALTEYLNGHPPIESPKTPVFSGTLPPDITFFGFDITPSEALGDSTDPGWFIVLEERISESRFGMDLGECEESGDQLIPNPPPLGWDGLSWGHICIAEGNYINSNKPVNPSDEEGPTWNDPDDRDANSAQIAWITMQKPVRIVVHASQMIPETADNS